MKSVSKRAFVMENCNSPYIAQAIFILKEGVDAKSSSVLQDAERIVATYMGRSVSSYNNSNKKHTGFIIALCASVLVLLSVFYFMLLS